MEEIGNWKIGVLGLGVSGRSAANFLAARGARVCAFDERDADAIDDLASLDPRIERTLGEPFPDVVVMSYTVGASWRLWILSGPATAKLV